MELSPETAAPRGGADPHHAEAIISVGRGTSVMIVSTILLLLFSFIGRVAVARNLSLDEFGDFSLGISLTAFLSLVALLGLHQAIARTLAYESDPGMRRKVLRLGAVITSAAAIISSTSIFLLAPELAHVFHPASYADLTLVFQMFAITLGMLLGTTFIASIFQGFENASANAWFNQVAQPAAFVAFVGIFLLFHLNLFATLLAWLLSNVAMFIGILIYAWRNLPPLLPHAPIPDRPIEGLFGLSISLWGVTTMQFVTAYADTLILGAFRPETDVGVYAAAMTLGRLLLAGNGALTYIFLPVAARLKREGKIDALRKVFVTSTRWILVVTVPLFFLFALLPGPSIKAVFGGNYATFPNATLALSLITIGSMISVLVGPVNSCLAGLGMTRTLLMTTVVSAGSNILLSFLLIPSFGLQGASIAWTIARALYPTSGLLNLYFAYRITPFRRTLVVPFLASLAIGIPLFGALHFVHLPYWAVYPLYFVGVGIVLLSLLVTRSIEDGDLVAFRSAEKLLGRSFPRVRKLLERGLPTSPLASAGAAP
ncbi:MAG TPA: flippase [Thermoplasmata archaeon]|nr:flippase [Thermoplasmata archaeon]